MAGTRRSSRLKAKKQDEDSAKENQEVIKPPPPKRGRKKAQAEDAPEEDGKRKVVKGKGRNLGKLRALLEMPLDILFEIFGQLHPLDLLRLSWTSKEFRSTVMRRSARSVWIQVLQSIENLPPCPDDLTEPQWAFLLFYPCCHYCGSQNCQTIVWVCRVRCCNKCLKQYFVSSKASMFKPLKGLQILEDMLFNCVPHHIIESKNKLVYHKSEAEILVEKMNPMPPKSEIIPFLDAQGVKLRAREEHAKLCEEWYEAEKTKRTTELMDLRFARRTAIATRLCAVGLGAELNALLAWDINAFVGHPLVSQPKELTERIWNNIKTPLMDFVRMKGAERLESARISLILRRDSQVACIYSGWLSTQSRSEAYPSMADICFMKEFNDIIMRPADLPVMKEDYYPAVAALPRLVGEWRARAKLELCKLLPELPEEHRDRERVWHDPRRVELATSIFHCKYCDSLVNYPQVLYHSCMTELNLDKLDYPYTEPHDQADDFTKRCIKLDCEPWNYNGEKLEFALHASQVAKDLVDACGLPSGTTTRDDMNGLNVRFVCMDCPHDGMTLASVMAWNVAISHRMRKHKSMAHNSLAFRLLAPQDEEQALELERAESAYVAYDWMANTPGRFPWRWLCSECHCYLPESLDPLLQHMASHGIEADADMKQHMYYHESRMSEFGWPPQVDILCLSRDCQECCGSCTEIDGRY